MKFGQTSSARQVFATPAFAYGPARATRLFRPRYIASSARRAGLMRRIFPPGTVHKSVRPPRGRRRDQATLRHAIGWPRYIDGVAALVGFWSTVGSPGICRTYGTNILAYADITNKSRQPILCCGLGKEGGSVLRRRLCKPLNPHSDAFDKSTVRTASRPGVCAVLADRRQAGAAESAASASSNDTHLRGTGLNIISPLSSSQSIGLG